MKVPTPADLAAADRERLATLLESEPTPKPKPAKPKTHRPHLTQKPFADLADRLETKE